MNGITQAYYLQNYKLEINCKIQIPMIVLDCEQS